MSAASSLVQSALQRGLLVALLLGGAQAGQPLVINGHSSWSAIFYTLNPWLVGSDISFTSLVGLLAGNCLEIHFHWRPLECAEDLCRQLVEVLLQLVHVHLRLVGHLPLDLLGQLLLASSCCARR